jgi:hypothetical protein
MPPLKGKPFTRQWTLSKTAEEDEEASQFSYAERKRRKKPRILYPKNDL